MKQQTATIIAILALIVAGYGFIRPQSQGTSQQDIFDKVLADKKLSSCYAVWPPSVIKDPNTSELSGFMIDAARAVAKDAGFEISFIESTWGGFPADISSGKCDAGIAGFYPLVPRSTTVAFTRPFYFAGNSGVVKTGDTRFKSVADLNKKGIKVAVIQGEFAHLYSQKNLPNAELVVLEKSSDNTAPLLAVTAGQADAGLIMEDTVKEYVKAHSELKEISGTPYAVSPISWVTRKADQQLLNFLNNAINNLENDGDLDRLAKQYGSTWSTEKKQFSRLTQ